MEIRVFVLSGEERQVFASLYNDDISALDDNVIMLGALADNVPAGLLIATITSQAVAVDWLYVDEEKRDRGVGSRLLEMLMEAAGGMVSIKSVYIATTQLLDLQFYYNMGFDILSQDRYFVKTTLQDIRELPQLSDKLMRDVQPLDQVPTKYLNQLSDHLSKAANIDVGVPLPINAAGYAEGSFAYVKGNNITALTLIKEYEEETAIAYVYSASQLTIKHVLATMAAALKAAGQIHTPERVVTMGTLNDSSLKLVEKLFENYTRQTIYELIKYV